MDPRAFVWAAFTSLALGLYASGCNSAPSAPPGDSSSGVTAPPAATITSAELAPIGSEREAAPACETLRDVGASDVVKVDGSTLFYVDATSGLSVVDLSDVERPRPLARVPFVGTPLVMYVRDGLAWVVFYDWDGRALRGQPSATVVRAIDVREPSRPRVVGEAARPGLARDAKLVGGVLYLLRPERDASAVEAFRVRYGALRAVGAAPLAGKPGRLAASSAGLAAVTIADGGADVAWLDLPQETPGAMHVRGVVRVPGGFASWERGDGHLVDATDGKDVRLVTCATAACSLSEPATLRIVDFGGEAPARLRASLRVADRGGVPVTRFVDETLYLAELAPADDDASALTAVRLGAGTPKILSRIPLHGTIGTLVPREGSLVALGSTRVGDRVSIVVHDVDVRRPEAPRVRSSVRFGSDWTWSVANDDERAASFDPGSRMLAVPFTAWRKEDRRGVAGAQIVDLGGDRVALADTFPSGGWIERAVFVGGRVVTVGPDGVASFAYGKTEPPHGELR